MQEGLGTQEVCACMQMPVPLCLGLSFPVRALLWAHFHLHAAGQAHGVTSQVAVCAAGALQPSLALRVQPFPLQSLAVSLPMRPNLSFTPGGCPLKVWGMSGAQSTSAHVQHARQSDEGGACGVWVAAGRGGGGGGCVLMALQAAGEQRTEATAPPDHQSQQA